MDRLVVLVSLHGAQLLDVAGPADAFALVESLSPTLRYRVRCVSSAGGPIITTSGLRLDTEPLSRVPISAIDTLIFVGGAEQGLAAAIADARLRRWVARAAPVVRRLASVCTGAFALARWGLLDGRRATTHWSVVDRLQAEHPQIRVDRTALYVRDGNVWTAGGVTTGIDMSLAMIEADGGRVLAGRVAGMLVLSTRRVGNQAQYSTELRAQSGRYAELIEWLGQNLRRTLDVSTLAARAHESERTFCRRFAAEVGQPPGEFVERLRVQAAQRLLEGGTSVKTTAQRSGFSSPEHLCRVFRRRLELSPTEYRRRHDV